MWRALFKCVSTHRLYRWVERRFFYTLTRKLSIIVWPSLLTFAGAIMLQDNPIAGLPASTAIALLALAMSVAFWFYLHLLITVPVKQIRAKLDALSYGDGDLGTMLTTDNQDEFFRLCESYNIFAAKLRDMLKEVRRSSITIAVGTAKAGKVLQNAGKLADSQTAEVQGILASSDATTIALDHSESELQKIVALANEKVGLSP